MRISYKRWCGILSLILLGAGLPGLSQAQSIAITHCQGECPAYGSNLAAANSKLVVHNLYAAGINQDSGLADWVAYRLTGDAIGVASLLPRSWQPDRLAISLSAIDMMESDSSSEVQLAEISVVTSPYAGSTPPERKSQDRARLAPMTSFANTPYWSDLNNLTNMVPMPTALRLGAWLQLEQAVNHLAAKEELYVIAGPLYVISQPLTTSPAAFGLNPSAYFKIIAGESGYASFVFPENLDQHESFCAHQSQLSDLEKTSDLEFFPSHRSNQSAQLFADLGCN